MMNPDETLPSNKPAKPAFKTRGRGVIFGPPPSTPANDAPVAQAVVKMEEAKPTKRKYATFGPPPRSMPRLLTNWAA